MSSHRLTAGFTITLPDPCPEPIRRIAALLIADGRLVLGNTPKADAGRIAIELTDGEVESWRLVMDADGARLLAADELGAIYGLLSLSRHGLGIDPWHAWYEVAPAPRDAIDLDAVPQTSSPMRSRYRGWFINDEVLLRGWTCRQLDQDQAWHLACQTLLRLGGNLIIPGTMNLAPMNWPLVRDYGLWITHHHHEPLGSHMVLKPLKPFPADFRYADHQHTLEAGWQDAVDRQTGQRTVWGLGFRGHGDYPFWHDDTSFTTDADRGAMISRQIARQQERIHATDPDAPLCVNVYGEIAELYHGGHLDLPADCIRIWADNGYGAQLSRHIEGDNEGGDPSLPQAGDDAPHGIYTHVTFNDRRGANHLLPWTQDPAWLRDEAERIAEAKADHLVIVNCGNIRPHVRYLDLWATIWSDGPAFDVVEWERGLAERLLPGHAECLRQCWQAYSGARQFWHDDDFATIGDQFHHKHLQLLLDHAANEEWDADTSFNWIDPADSLTGQIAWFGQRWQRGISAWQEAVATIDRLCADVPADVRNRIDQLTGDAARFHLAAHRSAAHACAAMSLHAAGATAAAWWHLRQGAGHARKQLDLLIHMEGTGIWRGFYDCDGQTNVACSLATMQAYQGFLRLRYGGKKLHINWTIEHNLHGTDRWLYASSRLGVEDDDLADRLERQLPAEQLSLPFGAFA